MKELQKRVYNLIREDDENKLSGTIFDTVIIVFIVISVAFVVLDTFSIPQPYRQISAVIEVVSIIVFTFEYILRLWTAPLIYPELHPALARLRYATSFMLIVDLLSILPFYLPILFPTGLQALRALRILRLLRVFKITRYTDSLTMVTYVFKKKARQLIFSVLIIFMLMLIAAVLMYSVESTAQPDKFNNAFSAFWWALSTVTTIGYGDLYPITPLGQVLGTVIALLGIGLVALPTGIISSGFLEANRLNETEGIQAVEEAIEEVEHEDHSSHPPPSGPEGSAVSPDDKKHYCPYCGHRLD